MGQNELWTTSRLNLLEESDFVFNHVKVPAVSTAGTFYWREVPFGMPRIPPEALRTVFYLYPSVEAARDGRKFGGTGFLYGMPAGAGRWLVYGISNWHVAVRDGCSVIRVNTKDGCPDIFDFDPGQWHFKPRWHDLAAVPFPINDDRHRLVFLTDDTMATPSKIASLNIGPGEDIFMVGRFVDHDGGATNVPAVRFGNISVMPQPIEQPTGAAQLPSYILDVHSRSGYSGSPVFVYRTVGSDLTSAGIRIGGEGSKFVYFLGVHWGQFPEDWEIATGKAPMPNAVPLVANQSVVKGFSGMTLAIPATAIHELLDIPSLKEPREAVMEELKRLYPSTPVAESATPKSVQVEPAKGEANPNHKEAFTSLLNAASKKNQPAD